MGCFPHSKPKDPSTGQTMTLTTMQTVQTEETQVNVEYTGKRKEFVDKVRERSIGAEVMQSLTPAQTVVKIVHEELIELLGKPAPLNTSGQPRPSIDERPVQRGGRRRDHLVDGHRLW